MLKPIGDVHEVVIAIEEDNINTFHPIPPAPKPRTSSQNSTTPSIRLQAPTPPQADRPTTPISLIASCPSSTSLPRSHSVSLASMESSPCSHTSSPTLVRKGSTASTGTCSPVMRSMFPRYDPTLPLAQQRYYPNVEIDFAMTAANTRVDNPGSYSPSMCTQPESLADRRETGSPSGLRLQNAGKLSERIEDLPGFSTPVELVDFWALANGQMNLKAAKECRLELSWYVDILRLFLYEPSIFKLVAGQNENF